jgi:cell wall-associated NlpC family hydrolase
VNPARAVAGFPRSTTAATRIVLITAVATLTVMLTPAGQAQADPTRRDAEQKVAALSKQMEVTTEQYNDAREELKQSQARVKALEPRATQLRKELDAKQSKLSAFAASAYYGGRLGMFSSILDSGSPQAFLDQVAFLEQMSAEQRAELTDLVATKRGFDAAKAKVDAELVKQAANEKTLRDKRSAINKDLAQWQSLSAKLGGRKNGAVPALYDGPTSGNVGAVLSFAYAQQGKPYEWAAAGPQTYDCSGFTMAAWARAGVSLPHSSRLQYESFPKVSLSSLQKGDLVFYGMPPHHVALYIGGGKVLHAPESGDVIRIASVGSAGGSPSGAVRPH